MLPARQPHASEQLAGTSSKHAHVKKEPDNFEFHGSTREEGLRTTLGRWIQLFRVVRHFDHRHRHWLHSGVGAALGVTLLRLALPWPLHALLMPWLQGEQSASLTWASTKLDVTLVAGVLFAVCIAALGFADARTRLSFARFSIGTVRDLRKAALRAMSAGPVQGKPSRSGDMVARLIGDAARVKAGLKGFLVHVAVNGLLLAGITAVMLSINLVMGVLFGLCTLAVFSVAIFGARNIYVTACKYRKKEGHLAHAIVKVAKFSKNQSVDIGHTLPMSRKVLASYKKANRSSGRSEARITRLTGNATWAAHGLLGLFVLTALLYGAHAMAKGTLTSADLLFFALYTLSARTPVVQIARQGVRTGKILACLGRLQAVLARHGSVGKSPFKVYES